ncbi:hypothetical protein [Streptomyces sp. NPDC046887]|uniref:hypothetical protein n=1 Tax=Streptomyces sp. NPDC046887 TaxID=3155472 RepID=UPI0033C2E3DA
MADRMTYLTADGLRGRGWTDGMVGELLGWPDVQGRDPRRRTVAPVRLYLLARVEAVERSPEFAGCAEAAGRGGAAARAAAERRRRAVLAAVAAEPIRVPLLPVPELERRSARHRRLLAGASRSAPSAEPPDVSAATSSRPVGLAGPPGALVRWQVDYLQHALGRYDALLDGLFGTVGRAEAERLLRRRILEAVAGAYPHLAAECRRRLR